MKNFDISIAHLSNVAGRKGGGISDVVQSLNIKLALNNTIKRSDIWFPGDNALVEEIASDTSIEKERLYPIETIRINNFSLPYSIFCKRNTFITNYNIIHQHGIWLLNSLFTRHLSKRIKTIISPHGLLEPEKFEISRIKKQLVYSIIEKANLQRASCIVACSEKEAYLSLKKLNLETPIIIIPNGVEDSIIINKVTMEHKNQTKMQVLGDFNLKPDTKVMSYLSRIHSFKGLELFIDSLFKVRSIMEEQNWIFVIAGISENNHEYELKEKVKKLAIGHLIKFVGPIFGEKKWSFLDASDLFVLPSKGENFGIVVLEAMARGIPVLTTKNTPWEILNNRHCGFCVNRSLDSFVNILKVIMNEIDNNKLIEMGEISKQIVIDKFTWNVIKKKYINMYQWVLSPSYINVNELDLI